MLALSIVEHLDVIKDIRTRRLPVRVDATLDPFPLEQLEEALGHSIIEHFTVQPGSYYLRTTIYLCTLINSIQQCPVILLNQTPNKVNISLPPG